MQHYSGVSTLEVMSHAKNYNAFIKKLISNGIEKGREKTIVDFGAGTGEFSFFLKGKNFFAVEPDSILNSILVSQNVQTKNMSDFDRESIDFIYSINVLEHIDDDEFVLEQFFRSIKQKGKLFIYVPAFMFLWTELDTDVGHIRRYSKKDLITKIETAGFKVTKIRYADSLGYILLTLHKFIFHKFLLEKRKLIIFDRLIFPLSIMLDKMLLNRLFGKNLYVYAEK